MFNGEEMAFFQALVEAPSPSGYEQPAQRLVRLRLEPVADELRFDVLGNLFARKQAATGSARRLMLTAHCDEIGLMVTGVNDQGFLLFAPIGGADAQQLAGRRIWIHGRAGAVPGVIGKKAIHLIAAAERDKVVPLKDLYIDCGFVSREQALAQVSLGDPVTFDAGLQRLAGERVVCRALDDKMGVFVITEAFRRLAAQGPPPVELLAVSMVQEELGLRGATAGTYAADPSVALVVEVGHASDVPGMDPRETGEMRLGAGPVLVRGANVSPVLFELLRHTAEVNGVPYQVVGTPGATSTDAKVVQLSRSGVATALVRVPLRYMHSTVEMLDLADLENAVRLLVAAVPKIAQCQSLIPH